MELEQIRRISLVGFLEDMGHIPVSRKGNDVWFRSPFRNERTASFKVDTQRNVWFDFGLGKGGDIFHLAGELTGSTGFMEQLEFLSGKSGILPLRPLQERKKIPRVSGFEDVKVTELSHEALKGYLKERGIDPAIAGRFCKEVAYGIRGKRYFAIGFMNRSGGYELRNPMFKGCISPKDISYVSLSGKKQDTCCVFEGFVDFLSALVLRTVTDEDCLVLNSVSNLERSYAVLEGYGKIRCFLDRDRAGITALETLNIHFGNKVMDCSGLYDGLKDLNEYLTKTKENKGKQMKTEKNMRKGFGLAGKIAMFCIGLVSLVLTSCESELEIQQSYPFTVETMPVPKELNRNEMAEIRCELKSEGDFDGTVYTIRYFQYDGEGSLKLDNGLEFKPNDRYLLENRKFRLYYTSLCDEAQNFIVVVEDNWGNMTEMEFDFNDAGDEETGTVEDSLSVQEGGAL